MFVAMASSLGPWTFRTVDFRPRLLMASAVGYRFLCDTPRKGDTTSYRKVRNNSNPRLQPWVTDHPQEKPWKGRYNHLADGATAQTPS